MCNTDKYYACNQSLQINCASFLFKKSQDVPRETSYAITQ